MELLLLVFGYFFYKAFNKRQRHRRKGGYSDSDWKRMPIDERSTRADLAFHFASKYSHVEVAAMSFAEVSRKLLEITDPHAIKIQDLHAQYREALAGADKADALKKGRAYYRARNRDGGTVTLYDEQAIANDLQTMD